MLPLWLKVIYLLFLFILIPVYYKKYGPENFLWFSDLGLFGTGLALWIESSLLISMVATGVLLPELFWNVLFFLRLFTGKRVGALTDYMFDPKNSLFLRGLSLFHVILPPMILYLLHVLGYDRRALLFQTGFMTIVLVATYYFTDPAKNINFAFGPGEGPQRRIHPTLYLMLIIVLVALLILLPSHYLLYLLFKK